MILWGSLHSLFTFHSSFFTFHYPRCNRNLGTLKKAGVREYWIIDPETKTLQVCALENGQYIISMYSETDIVPVRELEGCEIDLRDVFTD
jgi:hypothetical protein